tara:strand:+ start:329218 stop:330552 length:1335 start_codon:yes stop_codon:yes gene_type:complete
MLLDLTSEFYSLIRGALFILALYHLVIFINTKQKEYLYYSAYLGCFFIYFLKDTTPDNYLYIYTYINFSIQFLGYAAYVSFGRALLKTKKYVTDWDKLMVIEVRLFLVCSVLFIAIQALFDYSHQEKLWTILVPIFTVFGILTYIVLTKIKGKHVSYFIIGSLAYLILANISFLGPYAVGNEYFIEKRIDPMFFTYVGAIVETTMFAVIIGYKTRVSLDKSKEAEALLVIKTKEMSDLKMTALQSQMDPHFLYNSLNSINNFVIQNDVEKASDYITKFSRLIREILTNSSNLTISLNKELGVLGLYVKLEQMRMSGGFDYVVTVDDKIDLEQIKVPPLFIQPFIENAIWHGFASKKKGKKINVNIIDEDDKIRCEIIDNGIGIKNSKRAAANRVDRTRKSFGLKASEDRIKLLHENERVYVIIEDISDIKSTGTKVTLKFPKVS